MVDNKFIRIVYNLVIKIDEIMMNVSVEFNFDVNINSIIASFEKNPDKNGNPISAILFNPNIDEIIGVEWNCEDMFRISWYEWLWIILPAQRNIEDLKKACVIKWKNAMNKAPIEIENIIIAICLNVDIAIIFFISFSHIADNLE